MEDRRIKFAEAMLGRPFTDFERKTYLRYCDLFKEKPKLQLVIARGNGYTSALAHIAMCEKMYSILGKERDYHETQR